MLAIDLSNAVGSPNITNFTCMLMRLVLKADTTNKAKLSEVYPVEVEMCRIFKEGCPYKEGEAKEVDFQEIERQARERVGV
jgi:hypothetical protein